MSTTTAQTDGVRVLITGGTSRLGAAMSAALLDAGAVVAVTGHDEGRAEAAARDLGRGAIGIGMDVRDEDAVERGVDRALEGLGGLDILVNNAGIGMRTVNPRFITQPQPFWMVSPEGFRDVVATNLSGYFLVARAVVPRLLAAGGGRVVNISMNHSTMNRKGFVPYGPARAGAEALSRIMAADLAGSPVTVNLLLPGGATLTGMIPEDLPEEMRARLLPPSVMAEPIRWLCSPAAAGVHDQRIVANEFADWLAERGS
ncbi:MAG TPA: SDR family oxidoreductase [Mycobacteriales bacterium]|nr:SDR family oxidoreductase [Mycobacteriales bacterium]